MVEDGMLSIKTDGEMDLDQRVTDDKAAQQAKLVLRSASRSIETTAYETDSLSVDNLVDEYEGYYESDSQSGQPIQPGDSAGRQRASRWTIRGTSKAGRPAHG